MHGRVRGAASAGAVAVIVVCAIAGCAPEDDARPYATYESTSPFGVGDAALMEGTLAEVSGCLVIEGASGDPVLPLFPSNATSWDAAKHVLAVGGSDFAVGDPVAFGGGSVSVLREEFDVPAACPARRGAFIVSSLAGATP